MQLIKLYSTKPIQHLYVVQASAHSENSLPIDELGEGALRDGGARQDTSIEQGMQVSMETLGAATTRHRHTDDSVEILTYPYTYHIHQVGREAREQKAQHKHVSKLETTARMHTAGTLNMQGSLQNPVYSIYGYNAHDYPQDHSWPALARF